MVLFELIGIALLVLLVVVAIALIAIYNGLVTLQKRVDNAWAQIDVQLKRRADLIPNLIETVKGYAKFEKKVLTQVTEARTAMMGAKSPKESAKARPAFFLIWAFFLTYLIMNQNSSSIGR